jgi:hypothetical protein
MERMFARRQMAVSRWLAMRDMPGDHQCAQQAPVTFKKSLTTLLRYAMLLGRGSMRNTDPEENKGER